MYKTTPLKEQVASDTIYVIVSVSKNFRSLGLVGHGLESEGLLCTSSSVKFHEMSGSHLR